MATPEIASGRRVPRRFLAVLSAALLSTIIIVTGTIFFLSKGLPEESAETLQFPASGFNFAFGSGNPSGDIMRVEHFADGYALLSSGPVSIQADEYRVLGYAWLPTDMPEETAFFWRRADDPQNVLRTDITVPGTQLIDLSTELQWSGEIVEFGFLLAGENGKPVEVGPVSLIPDSLNNRLQLAWKAWVSFEEWSQQSINFLHGGDDRQILALPLLVVAWLILSLLFIWLFQLYRSNSGPGKLPIIAVMLFLLAWMFLDVRWATNNLKQIQLSLATQWQASEQQRLGNGLDGDLYQYVLRLKSSVLATENARILIIGEKDAVYYQLRAKYHLLPHSAHVASRFPKNVKPETLDFVIFFGEPASIIQVPGWNQSWQLSLIQVDRGEWGGVYRVK